MPNAYDRRRLPASDKDPNRVLDFGDIGEVITDAGTLIRDSITKVINEKAGIDLSSWEAFLASLEDGEGIDLPGLLVALATLQDAFAALGEVVNVEDLLERLSSWRIMPWQWGDGVPLALVSKESASLTAVGNFPNAAAIGDNPFWVFDPDVSSVADGTGSARCTADGTMKALHSVQFPVVPGEAYPYRGGFRWRGLASTGSPIKLGLKLFHTNGTQSDVVLGAIAPPGADSASGSHMDFVQVAGEWTAPAGVERAWLRALVEPGATAGSVWFDGGFVDTPEGVPDWLRWVLDMFGIGGLVDAIDGDTDNLLATFVEEKLNPLNLIKDETIRGAVKGMLDTLASLLRKLPLIGGQLSDSIQNFADAMEAQNDVVIGTASRTEQIAAALGRGVPAADDFERSALGARWRVITSNGGSVTVNGHDLVMAHTETTDYVLLDTEKTASSDYQTITMVLGSAPGFNTVLLTDARGHNDGWGRCTDFTTWATRTGIRVRWSGQNKVIRLSAWVNGTEVVVLFNAAVKSASAGSTLTVELGVLVAEQPRRFIIRVDGSIVAGGDIVESGTASQFGASHRRRGLGGRTEKLGVGDLAVSPDPGLVKQWAATG